jgi:hypothetical protein
MRKALIAIALLASTTCVMASEPVDTADSRLEAATRYADAYDLHARIDTLAANVTKDLPADERIEVLALINKHVRYEMLRQIQITALARTFSTRELLALEAFVYTQDGRTIMSKYGNYAIAIMPALNAEFERTLVEVKAELKDKSRKD